METGDVREFYNKTVGGSQNKYEFNRWQKTSQARASYISTREAVVVYVLPLLKNASNILELGPGPGTWTKLLIEEAPTAAFDLVDISNEMLKQAREALADSSRVAFINSDILEFTPTKKYDFFFSSRIIEYVPDKQKAIQIVSDSLISDSYGYIVTKTPHPKRFWGRKNQSPIHQHQVSCKELKRILEANNCSVLKVVNVTSVFPGLSNGFMDRQLTILCNFLPFSMSQYLSESYALIFRKK
jgi:SAM-dependent methyltransferase